jgi:hypothetical protein
MAGYEIILAALHLITVHKPLLDTAGSRIYRDELHEIDPHGISGRVVECHFPCRVDTGIKMGIKKDF